MVENFHQQLTSGQADFATLASKESHCSSAKRGGDLGKFEPGTMMPAFEEATYALKVMSGAVTTKGHQQHAQLMSMLLGMAPPVCCGLGI